MAILNLFFGSRANVRYEQGKTQGHAGKGVIAIEHNLAVSNVGDGID